MRGHSLLIIIILSHNPVQHELIVTLPQCNTHFLKNAFEHSSTFQVCTLQLNVDSDYNQHSAYVLERTFKWLPTVVYCHRRSQINLSITVSGTLNFYQPIPDHVHTCTVLVYHF